MTTRDFQKSEALLKRTLKTIPLGSQTFSKSHTQYARGVSPFFISRGEGARVWDVDGNEYIDFVSALAAITLGYNDPAVTAAVQAQLAEGTLFSLPHPIEMEVAEAIVEMVPCAEMVRFGKNGSDATAGAVRLARAHTSRDHVIACGYHGWQDWYIGATTRNKGVPDAVRALTHTVAYDDLDAMRDTFRRYPGGVAAVILEPMNVAEPSPGYLEALKEMVHENGALLIFDEMVTGFRLANGGAQAYFGVTPDLATLGKGMANGYPLSTVAGPERLMREMEEIFFSFTMGGETLSLAAALATLTKLRKEPVTATLAERGGRILSGVQELIEGYGMGEVLSVSGHPTWPFLNLHGHGDCDYWDIQTLYQQEMFARGVLCLGAHNLTYAHSAEDIETLLAVYDEVFAVLRAAVYDGEMKERLHCEPLQPLFRARGD